MRDVRGAVAFVGGLLLVAHAAGAQTVTAGRIAVEPAPEEHSELCVSGPALMNLLCPGTPEAEVPEEVRIVIRNGGGGNHNRTYPIAAEVAEEPGLPAHNGFVLELREMWGEDVQTPCGVWGWYYDIDTTSSNTLASIQLFALSVTGGFKADLTTMGDLVFKNTWGESARLPYRMSARYWTGYALAANPQSLQQQGYSNLLLFATSYNQGESVCPLTSCSPPGGCGRLCLVASPEPLAAANIHGQCTAP